MQRPLIEIRSARSSDIPLLAGLIREGFQDVAERFGLTPENCPRHPSNCTAEWVGRDLERGVQYFILESDHLPAGCVAIEQAEPQLCYLERLTVRVSLRRQGFGAALVAHAVEHAETLGASEISIGIIADQRELRRWYAKRGFQTGETKTFDHLPFAVTFMRHQCRKTEDT